MEDYDFSVDSALTKYALKNPVPDLLKRIEDLELELKSFREQKDSFCENCQGIEERDKRIRELQVALSDAVYTMREILNAVDNDLISKAESALYELAKKENQ
jgi:hypothetical protein